MRVLPDSPERSQPQETMPLEKDGSWAICRIPIQPGSSNKRSLFAPDFSVLQPRRRAHGKYSPNPTQENEYSVQCEGADEMREKAPSAQCERVDEEDDDAEEEAALALHGN